MPVATPAQRPRSRSRSCWPSCQGSLECHASPANKCMRQCFQEGPKRRECPTLCDPTDCSHQAPLSMGFSRPEYWSGLLFPSPGDLPSPGIEPRSPALQADSLPSEPPGKRKQSGGNVNCTQFHPLSTRVFHILCGTLWLHTQGECWTPKKRAHSLISVAKLTGCCFCEISLLLERRTDKLVIEKSVLRKRFLKNNKLSLTLRKTSDRRCCLLKVKSEPSRERQKTCV